MKTSSTAGKVFVVAAIVGAGALGAFLMRSTDKAQDKKPQMTTAASAVSSPSAVLASLPKFNGDSKTEQEIRKWQERVSQEPNNDRLWANLGDALMQKVRETLDTKLYPTVEQVYRQAWEINANNVDATIGIAWVKGAKHEFKESVEWAQKAAVLDAKNPAPYGIIGDAEVENGEYEQALDSYQKMLDLRPDIASYSRGAYLIYQLGDARKGMWLMDKAIKAGAPFAENTAWCKAQLAMMLTNEGIPKQADRVLTAALKETPSNPHVLMAMGQAKSAQKDYRAAITYYEKAIAIAPQHNALAALEELYRVTGKPDEAARITQKIEETYRTRQSEHIHGGDRLIALFYADREVNLPEALKLAQAEYDNHKSLPAMDTLAWCLFKNGKLDEADQMMQKVIRHRVPDPVMLFHAGMIAAKRGNRVDAQRHLYNALSRSPNFSPTQAPLAAETLRQLGSAQVAGR
jgi:tetratricopeptide (TPR) repeat protein